MAAKVENPTGTAAAIVATVFVLNWVSAKYWSYPFAWCFGNWAIQPVLEPWLFVSHFVALGYFCACALSRSIFKLVQGLMVTVIVFGFPTFMEILFRLGKSCG